MEKKQIVGFIIAFILVLGVLIFNYKKDSKSVDSNNDSVHDATMKNLLSKISGKLCCEEIGGIVSNTDCIFKDLDGKELKINYRYLEDYDGKNYCTDEYFDRK